MDPSSPPKPDYLEVDPRSHKTSSVNIKIKQIYLSFNKAEYYKTLLSSTSPLLEGILTLPLPH